MCAARFAMRLYFIRANNIQVNEDGPNEVILAVFVTLHPGMANDSCANKRLKYATANPNFKKITAGCPTNNINK